MRTAANKEGDPDAGSVSNICFLDLAVVHTIINAAPFL